METHVYIPLLYLEVPSIVLELIFKFLLHLEDSLKVTPFPRTMSKMSVNTESDHIYSVMSTLHPHDNHTPSLEHCASKKCNIQWADENDT